MLQISKSATELPWQYTSADVLNLAAKWLNLYSYQLESGRNISQEEPLQRLLIEMSSDLMKKMWFGLCHISLEKRGGTLSNKQKMEVFLRYVGDPGFQIGVGKDI